MQATNRPAYSLLAGPPPHRLHPSLVQWSLSVPSLKRLRRETRSIPRQRGGGAGELHRPELKINGKSTHISPHRRTNCEQRKCHIYAYIQYIAAPEGKGVIHFQFISAPGDQMWTKVGTHIQFISAPEDQLWTKGEKHTCSMHLRVTPIINVSSHRMTKCGQR